MTYSIVGQQSMAPQATPEHKGTHVLMMQYIQGEPGSLPDGLEDYHDFVSTFAIERGERGYLTIQDSYVDAGVSQRGYGDGDRTLHTEGCRLEGVNSWGSGGGWGSVRADSAVWTSWKTPNDEYQPVYLDADLKVLIGNSIDNTCAVWNDKADMTPDGDLGHVASQYPLSAAHIMPAGEIVQIGIQTPHECIPQPESGPRLFLRIVGNGVHGRAPHFTVNPKMA